MGANPLATNGNAQLGSQVSRVTGDASQTKNITITFDALSKGDIKVSNAEGLTWQQVEERFTDMLLRVVRNPANALIVGYYWYVPEGSRGLFVR